jgi:hypothetical protein
MRVYDASLAYQTLFSFNNVILSNCLTSFMYVYTSWTEKKTDYSKQSGCYSILTIIFEIGKHDLEKNSLLRK